MRSLSRRGFTLIELLVVIAIIAILIGLLLPAVQKVREAAARTQCSNNLKQLALASHAYHDVNGTLPHGGNWWGIAPIYNAPGTPAGPIAQGCGWGFLILPYIEQQNLYNGGGGATTDQCSINAMATPVKTMFCPSKRPPTAGAAQASWYGPGGTYPHAFCDYAGNAGTGNNGSIIQHTQNINDMIALIHITDGTSNTLLFGDKRLNRSLLTTYQGDDNEGYTSGWDHDTIRFTGPSYMPAADPTSGDGQDRFGSSHTGGFNIALADASVRFVRYSIDSTTWNNLGVRNDGAVLGDY